MEHDFSHLELSKLSSEQAHDIIENGLKVFRGNFDVNDREEPRYPLPQLFQAVAVLERVLIATESGKRETPPRELSEQEMIDPHFIDVLEFRTAEFIEGLRVCAPIMDARPGIPMTHSLVAVSLLNDLCHNPQVRTQEETRHKMCTYAMEYSLLYCDIAWTQEMHDNLMGWYPAAVLLCDPKNVPPMLGIVERMALDVMTSLETDPRKRFNDKDICAQFAAMIALTPSNESHTQLKLSLPPAFQM